MALKQNIIYIYFKGKHQVTSKSQYQYNRRQYLYFADLNLPQAFEVHFSNKDKGESKTQIGSDNLVEIPDEYFWNGALQIYTWIYLHSKTTDGETVYEVRIPLIKRAKPTDEEPLPVQQSAIDKAITELATAVDITNENVNKTNSDKTIVANIKDEVVILKENIDSTAVTINQKTQETINASERAETSAQNAAASERKALDYVQQAEQSAQSALESKNTANQKAEVATDAATETLGYRNESLEAKDRAVQAKKNIVDYRDETKGYRDETLNLKNNVQTLKNQIDETAEEIEDISDSVKEDAQSASQSASSASQSANSASQSANQAEQYKNQSETNVTHYPKVVDGYWYVWDASNEEWVNTNIDASGEDGISPTVTITNNETQGTHFIKITDKDGYKTATISDGLTVVMSPNSFVIPTDENGILINDVPLKVTFRAYRAKTPLTLSITNAETITLINPYAAEIRGVAWGGTTASTEPYVTATLSSGYKLQGGDSGKFEFTVKVDNKNIVLNSTWALAKRGKDGTNGIDGDDGYSPTANVSKSGKVATVTITDKNGTTSAQVEDGTDGTDGVSPTVTITPITGGHRITITDADGEHSADVMDGDDYTLTAQDKQDIAELVDVPVDDVQINGTSIVTDGVANVPMADDSNLGAVTVNGSYGIGRFGTNGALYINSPTSSYIKSGTNSYRPIVPKIQHESVFYGLAKIAGYDENNSALPVGQYTEDAKIAIQKMLGINQQGELIADVTATEDVTEFKVQTDVNGLPFELSKLIVLFTARPSTTGTRDSFYTQVFYKNRSGVIVNTSGPSITYPTATSDLIARVTVDAFKDMPIIETGAVGISDGITTPMNTMIKTVIAKTLTGFKFYQSGSTKSLIPAGSNIKVYGIRA